MSNEKIFDLLCKNSLLYKFHISIREYIIQNYFYLE